MRVTGIAHPPKSSARQEAELDLSQRDFMSLHVDGQIFSASIHDIDVTDSPGKLPSTIRLPSGWMFVPNSAEKVNDFLVQHGKKSRLSKLEKNAKTTIIGTLLMVGLIIGAFTYGISWFSKQVVTWLPDEVHEVLADYVLTSIDEEWLSPSGLPIEQQEAIRARFYQHLDKLPPIPFPPQLEFRSSDSSANAFALSGGVIIMLDDMVELAQTNEELDAILLHELGHIYHQHVMYRLVSSSLVSATVAVMTGESSGLIDTMVGAGVFVLQSGHSRESEIEADEFAKMALKKLYGTSEPLAIIFERLQEESMAMPEWLSSHPDMEKRIQEARD
ncbi:M48 family metallopeptidase [Vibrio sp. S9_S30]|uniref:M48 family metallopeptidase n=1 Tax=Vibrio sp. S9_S30 TaxID=2720226 RepID=UPI001680AD98|nr:M48 family metallopeptidase [Vibrio sp. S9_S30]MBD1557281.1 M48 family metallopeptidase [Vibrio sp. S9_S30]